jgi:hypothetical protein
VAFKSVPPQGDTSRFVQDNEKRVEGGLSNASPLTNQPAKDRMTIDAKDDIQSLNWYNYFFGTVRIIIEGQCIKK